MVEFSTMPQGPLDHLAGAARACADAELDVVPPCARFVLRCRPDAVTAAGQGFGVALPITTCRAVAAGSRAALWLGPDEWLLLAAPDDATAIGGQFSRALATGHSLVDVSHRSAALTVKGPQAAALINHGCPLDLAHAAFPVAMCTRTLFDKAAIILWRMEEHTYHVEIERSFAPYVWRMLIEAREQLIGAAAIGIASHQISQSRTA